jgi:hypothetical protein
MALWARCVLCTSLHGSGTEQTSERAKYSFFYLSPELSIVCFAVAVIMPVILSICLSV